MHAIVIRSVSVLLDSSTAHVFPVPSVGLLILIIFIIIFAILRVVWW